MITPRTPHPVHLPTSPQSCGLSDGALLNRFVIERSETAFRELVERLGPLVLSVARQVLHDRHAAEDVFQLTFLVLARHADRIRRPDALSAWIHGVALKISRKMLQRRFRERDVSREITHQESVTTVVPSDLDSQFQLQVLQEELQQLPLDYRAALILHYLQGQTCEETAMALDTTPGAIRGRLQRGKERLRVQLLRRGVDAPLVLLGLAFVKGSVSLPGATLVQAAVQTAWSGQAATTSAFQSIPLHGLTQEPSMYTSLLNSGLLKMVASCAGIAALSWLLAGAGTGQAEAVDPIHTYVAGPTQVVATVEVTQSGQATTPANAKPANAPLNLKYDDGMPDGKKSIAGTGQMVMFELPQATQKLASIRLHCARYGTAQAPKEEVEISIVSENGMEVVHTEMVPYDKFKRGEMRWTTIVFEEPVAVPQKFWVVAEFNAEQTKGVYVSYDTSTGGKYSRTGVPGGDMKEVSFGGDWMIQAVLTKPE